MITTPPPPPPPRKPWAPPRLETVEVESVWQGHETNPGDADSPSGNTLIDPNLSCPSS